MRLGAFIGRFRRAESGVAAVEMALIGGILTALLLNVAEVGRYAYLTTQVLAASQAGAYAAIAHCALKDTPVTLECPSVEAEITQAVNGTALGEAVALHGELRENWYCVSEAGELQEMGAADNRPSDCTDAGDPAANPSLYLRVSAALDYEPIFPGLTLVEAFPTTIVHTAWMRVA